MFTGLIEDVGEVVSLTSAGAGRRLIIATRLPQHEFRLGDSVAVNGACLTVTDLSAGRLSFDLSPESVERTTLRRLTSGRTVNLERALRLSDRLGGHLVSGHVDCLATVSERRELSGNIIFSFRLPQEFRCYVAAKGSVAIDGVSLTVNDLLDDGFTVNIIPHTARQTILHTLRVGDEVNIETDLLAKYLERLLSKGEQKQGLTLEMLAQNGFV